MKYGIRTFLKSFLRYRYGQMLYFFKSWSSCAGSWVRFHLDYCFWPYFEGKVPGLGVEPWTRGLLIPCLSTFIPFLKLQMPWSDRLEHEGTYLERINSYRQGWKKNLCRYQWSRSTRIKAQNHIRLVSALWRLNIDFVFENFTYLSSLRCRTRGWK